MPSPVARSLSQLFSGVKPPVWKFKYPVAKDGYVMTLALSAKSEGETCVDFTRNATVGRRKSVHFGEAGLNPEKMQVVKEDLRALFQPIRAARQKAKLKDQYSFFEGTQWELEEMDSEYCDEENAKVKFATTHPAQDIASFVYTEFKKHLQYLDLDSVTVVPPGNETVEIDTLGYDIEGDKFVFNIKYTFFSLLINGRPFFLDDSIDDEEWNKIKLKSRDFNREEYVGETGDEREAFGNLIKKFAQKEFLEKRELYETFIKTLKNSNQALQTDLEDYLKEIKKDEEEFRAELVSFRRFKTQFKQQPSLVEPLKQYEKTNKLKSGGFKLPPLLKIAAQVELTYDSEIVVPKVRFFHTECYTDKIVRNPNKPRLTPVVVNKSPSQSAIGKWGLSSSPTASPASVKHTQSAPTMSEFKV